MKFLHIVVLCFFSAVDLEASEVLEVSGHVGGEVSIRCSGSWTTGNSSRPNNMYFCKGVCSGENILIQTDRNRTAVTQGRYRLEVSRRHNVFNVTIRRLKRADAGKYCCRVEQTFNTVYQDINLEVINAATVPPGSASFTTSLQIEAEALSQGNLLSSTESAALTVPATEKTDQQAATSLTDTTVVIIVSVSLALLVCAVIPLIFYGHWRSHADGQTSRGENKGEVAVRLQSLEPDADPGSSAQNTSQYAAVYQALDPKPLD